MAPIGVACQAIPRWLTTPLAASPASFQPSNPAMATGDVSPPMSLNSMTGHLPTHDTGRPYSLRGRPCSMGYHHACPGLAGEIVLKALRMVGDEHTTVR